MTTMMSWYMQILLKELKANPDEFMEIPPAIPKKTVAALVAKDWIQTSPEGDRAKITGRGAVALLTSDVYPQSIPAEVREVQDEPVAGDEIDEELDEYDADERPYVLAEQIRPFSSSTSNGGTDAKNRAPTNGKCEDCEDCLPARLLARLKLVNPKIARVIDAWIEAEKALEELT